MADVALSARNLTKKYGDFTAVDRLSLDVAKGEIFGLLGPNGAGKTTTILMLLGLTEPTSGTALVNGLDPTRDPLEVKRGVGYLPDNVGFYSELTAFENLAYTARLNRIKNFEPKIRERVEEVGLSDSIDKKVGEYSRGMRQRLGIADALLKDPDIVILDEPTIALDPQAVDSILELIHRLPKERGVSVLLSSHQLRQVQSICDRVAIFVKGRIVAAGSVDSLASQTPNQKVTIEIGTDSGDLWQTLNQIPDVALTQGIEGRVLLTADRDVRAETLAALAKAGITPNHLVRQQADLDEVYKRWFEEAS